MTWLAARQVDWGEATADGPSVGLNVDGLCTLLRFVDEPCLTEERAYLDGIGGRDNVGGPILGSLLAVANDGDPALPIGARMQAAIDEGQTALLLGLFDWNGGPDDAEVGVVFSYALQVRSREGGRPVWDGTDLAATATLAIDAESMPHLRTAGYFSGGILDVTFADVAVPVPIDADETTWLLLPSLRVVLNVSASGISSADVGAAWRTSDTYRFIQTLGFCGDEAAAFNSAFLNGADLRLEGAGPSERCDGISLGWRWDLAPVRVGGRGAGSSVAARCSACGGSHNCEGSCVDLQNDPANCGACASVCVAGSACREGACL